MIPTWLVAQIGARMHYAVPRLLHQAGRLQHFCTDICAVKGWPRALRLLPAPLRTARLRRLLARAPLGLPGSRITAFTPFGREYARRLARAVTPTEVTAAVMWAGRTFCEKVVARGLGDAAAVYTFNNAGLELLRHARENGRFTVLEQTIAPKQIEHEWMEAEQDKFSGWEVAAEPDRLLDRFIERQAAEWQAADVILCGSEFVCAGIARCGGPAHRCRVVPYGVDSSFCTKARAPRRGPLRVLTVGTIGLRKGSPYVLAAARELRRRAIFRMVGEIKVAPGAEAQLRDAVELTGPVPRSEILEHFQWGDVFLLPSLCEGSATVVYEALACGLPVIATSNTGTVVRNGIEGFIVSAGESEGIVQSLEQLMEDRDRWQEMSEKARRRSAEFNFSMYGKNLLAALQPEPSAPLKDEPSLCVY
jgi:glycosyltransferase involved in cell wall biosynthesis